MRQIRTAINFRDLALECGRQSTRSSHEVCLQNASRNLTRFSSLFLQTRGGPGKPGRLKDRERHGTGDKDEKFCKWNTNFHWEVSAGKTGLPFPEIPFIPENFQWDEPKNRVPFTSQREFREFFGKWKKPISTIPAPLLTSYCMFRIF